MDKKEISKNIPIMFQNLKEFDIRDTRFTKTKIWLMHLGENLNGSYFDEEATEKAVPSLANTPILTYIEDNSDGEKDCSDHREVLAVENGEYKIKYLGQAVGVIPETNNAKFENRVCDDGIERTFLTCEGLIWNKWNDIQDIMNRDVKKQQSMELHESYDGVFGEDGLFHFTKFKFFGACILGKDVQPAMRSASVELQEFSYKNFAKEIQAKLEMFKEYMKESEEDKMDKEKEKVVEEEIIETKNKTTDEKEMNEPDEIDVVEEKEEINIEEYSKKINSLSEELKDLKQKYSNLEKENKELSEFKSSRLKEDRKQAENELFSQYEELKDTKEFNELKNTSDKFQKLEDLEKELALLYVKNQKTFSKELTEEKKTVKFQVEKIEETDDGYGGLLNKYVEK
ncbi:hypothetical protein CF086_16815 [Clostridium botulinum]|uniref:hypothetical protein n=1 Tax=Clostridium botulinum TaxID=1491 RepID=UPI0007749755|nr:hypothetical protein [Clostridium botulinum]MBN3351957.1 hypothetical protein [Clostridium botulinum]